MRICIWTDNDLDGAGSALIIKKIYTETYKDSVVEINEVNDNTFVSKFKAWYPSRQQYQKIYITDHHIQEELVELVDQPNFVIIDHHKSHVDLKDRYKQAKVIIEDTTSTVALLIKTFKVETKTFATPEFLDLLAAIDDYDCYKLNHKHSLNLNAIFGTYSRPRSASFIANFENGMRSFTLLEKNAIKIYFNKLKDQLQNTEYFTGMIKQYTVTGCFATHAINEVAHFTLKRFNTDIVIVINPVTKNVSFRRSRTCDAKLNILAEKLCEGGGHEAAAGGKLTNTFLKFTTTLIPC